MTLDASAISSLHTPQHVTGNGLAWLPLTCRRMRWYCVFTEHRREQIASNAIRDACFETYLPIIRQQRALGRSEIVPCFPRYVMVRFDASRDDWGKITVSRGVAGIIRHAPGRPTPLPDYAIDELLARTSSRGIVDDPGERPYDGPGAGYRPVWQDMTGLDAGARLRLLLRLFGASVTRQVVGEDAA